jgi:hypothetical protein
MKARAIRPARREFRLRLLLTIYNDNIRIFIQNIIIFIKIIESCQLKTGLLHYDTTISYSRKLIHKVLGVARARIGGCGLFRAAQNQ